MSKTDDQLRSEIDANETRGEWGAWGVIVGLVLEVVLATANSLGYGNKQVENWGAVLADALVAIGVYAEVHFGRRASHGLAELRRRSDEKVAIANTSAAAATERAANLEKEAAALRLEQEQLRARLAWRRLDETQFQTVVNSLSGALSKAQVMSIAGDPETALFAEDIRRALTAAGAEVQFGAAMYGPEAMIGLLIFGPMEAIRLVATAFARVGISVGIGPREGDLEIVVGSKPPPGWQGGPKVDLGI